MPRFSKSTHSSGDDGNQPLSKTLPRDHVCEVMGGHKSPRKDKSKATNFIQLQSPQSGRNQSQLTQLRKAGVKLKGSYATQMRNAARAEARHSADTVWNSRLGVTASKK